MKKTSKIISLMLTGVIVLSMSTCGGNTAGTTTDTTAADTAAATAAETAETSKEGAGEAKETSAQAADDTTYKIDVLQLVQHTALDAANQGFVAALDDAEITYGADQQNISGDQSACQTVASKFTNDKEDLILTIVTPTAQAVAGAVSDAPVPMTAAADPAESGLVGTNEKPGGNVTGTSDLTPVKEQVGLLQKVFPDAKKVGILYCLAESNLEIQAQMAEEIIETAGMTSQDFTVSSSNEIQTVVQSMVDKMDAIYASTDNTITAGITTVGMVVGNNKPPIVCGEPGVMGNDGLATYEIDYYQLDYMTGQQAARILTEGASPTDMPIRYLPAEKRGLTVNGETASTLGIDVSNLK